MEQHIDDALQPQPGQRLGKLRPDAFQVGQRGKERIEYLGSHGSGVSCLAFPSVSQEANAPFPYLRSALVDAPSFFLPSQRNNAHSTATGPPPKWRPPVVPYHHAHQKTPPQ